MFRNDLIDSNAIIESQSQQILLLSVPDISRSDAFLEAAEYNGSRWLSWLGPIPAKIGQNGFGKEREGDLKSPGGIYCINGGFGWGRVSEPLRIPWRKSQYNDYFFDDPDSPYYNQWIRTDEAPLKLGNSWERLHIPQYKFSICFDFNKDNQPGLGSAIFLHVWKGPHLPTAGCTAIPESAMIHIVHRLDAERNPIIIQAESTQIQALRNKLSLV
ncbi:MAG TPA: hypothetical protein ENN84_02885 [Candidatus Marinimicrobia bacterium]|nr:hypothetical protein [Candidatus Neomarinimicrobiota bacterium]